jgi:hypothetical protein
VRAQVRTRRSDVFDVVEIVALAGVERAQPGDRLDSVCPLP